MQKFNNLNFKYLRIEYFFKTKLSNSVIHKVYNYYLEKESLKSFNYGNKRTQFLKLGTLRLQAVYT